MLSDVRLQGSSQLLRLWVLTQLRGDHRVLHHHVVHGDVCVVVLVQERLDGLELEDVLVLGDRVDGLLVFFQRHDLLGVLDAQNRQHPPVKLRQVVNLRSHLRHLDGGLELNDALRQRGSVGIADGDHVHQVVVALLGTLRSVLGIVGVVRVRVVADQVLQELELLLEREVRTGLDSGEDFELAFEQRQGRTHGRLRRHVGHLHVCGGSEATAFLNNIPQQLVQDAGRLLVRQRQDAVADVATSDVHIAELARSDGGVVTLDAQPSALQTSRQIAQRTRIHQLSHQRRRGFSEPANQVEQAKAIRPEAGDVLVVHEVLALEFEWVVLTPISPYC